ncbi:ATP-dependent helicase, partial (plasmid) [Trichormus variabilis FSR]|nr:ATP-dependent helicase [Trichormus variabilis FSR]
NLINELQDWLTEENLTLVADYLSDCQDISMISSLCEIYHKLVIKAAIDRVSQDKRDQISQWVAQLERRTEFKDLYFH